MTPPLNWQPILERRVVFATATVASPILAAIAGSRWGVWALLPILGLWLAALGWLRACRCPACGSQFLAGLVFPFSTSCGSCGESHLAPVSVVPRASGSRPGADAPSRELSRGQRRFVGGAMAIAGGAVLIGHAIWPNPTVIVWWQQLFLVSFAALSMLGGASLYRGTRAGYTLTRFVLAAQVVAFVLPGAAYEVLAGPYGSLHVGSATFGFRVGWAGSFMVWLGQTTGWTVSVNFLALALYVLIRHDSPPVQRGADSDQTMVGADGRASVARVSRPHSV